MNEMELRFTGSVPATYDRLMVPLLFQPYADEMATRAREFGPDRILETAAGTGVVTQVVHEQLPQARIVATDISPQMLDMAQQRVKSEHVRFEQANAQDLPFDEASFDLVVCQFGSMMFPDRVRAHSEARRVLGGNGHYLLAIWDRIERNALSETAQQALIDTFPDDPPMFMREGPFSYHDRTWIEADLRQAGFTNVDIDTVELRSRSASANDAATALCYGTPMGGEIQDREPGSLERAFERLEQALNAFVGPNGIDAPMSAHIVTASG